MFHTVFNLTTLSILGVLILCFGFLFQKKIFTHLKVQNQNTNARRQQVYTLVIVVAGFGLASMLTLKSYYDAPRIVFSNADHHALQKLGFSFRNKVSLIDEKHKEKAYFSHKEGFLNMTDTGEGVSLRFQSLNEPLYIQNPGEEAFDIVNAPYTNNIQKSLKIVWPDGIGIELQFRPEEKEKYSYRILQESSSSSLIPIPFDSKINIGYPLAELLWREPASTAAYDSLIHRLGQSLLVRKKYNSKSVSDLLFFPDRQLNVKVSIDGAEASKKTFSQDIHLTENSSFFLGLAKKTTPQFNITTQGSDKYILLKMPEMHYLYADGSDSLQHLFLTTKAETVIGNNKAKGFLLEGPEHENAEMHFSGSLSYRCDDTNKRIAFRFLNENQNNAGLNDTILFKAGETIRISPSSVSSQDFSWLLKIEDLKGTNAFSAAYYYGYSGLFIFFCLLALILTPTNRLGKSQVIETAAYIFLILMITIRSVLLWRATTFIPLERLNYNGYQLFRNILFHTNFKLYQSILTALFFIGIILYKNGLFSFKGRLPNFRFTQNLKYWQFGIILLSFYALNYILSSFHISKLERFFNILIPLIIYFAADHLLQKQALKKYEMVTFSKDYYVLSTLNWIFCFLSFAVLDAGFTLIFIVFTLLFAVIKSTIFKDHKHVRLRPHSTFWKAVWLKRRYAYGILLTAFLWYSARLISFAFRHTLFTLITGFIFLILLLWSIYPVYAISIKNKWKVTRIIVITGFITCGLATVFKDRVNDILAGKNRMLYRAEILHKSPDNTMMLEEFQSGNDIRILNAAQNKWIIDYYTAKASIFPFFNSYFKLQPHFNTGSSYETQLSDLVAIRYLSSEHGTWLIINIILMICLLMVITVQYTENYNLHVKSQIAVLTFLFALAYCIWLTSTNRLVFVGQDFPLLSLNSLLSMVMAFMLIGYIIFSAYQTHKYNPELLSEEYHEENLKGFDTYFRLGKAGPQKKKQKGESLLVNYFIPLLALSLILFLLKDYSTKKFDLNDTIKRLETKFKSFNVLFSDFQDNKTFPTAEAAFTAFDKHLQDTRQLEKLIGGDTNRFYGSAYAALKNKLIRANSSQNLIHLRKDTDGKYIFAVNGFYYTSYNPDEFEKGWKGNLTEPRNFSTMKLTEQSGTVLLNSGNVKVPRSRVLENNTNVRVSYLPAGWTPDGNPVFIVSETHGSEKANQNTFRIINGNEQYTSKKSSFAFMLKDGDRLRIESENSYRNLTLGTQDKSYFARNIWLNGKYQFFYPMGEKFLWSYHFANFLKEAYREDESRWKQDVPVTLDYDLTEKIHKILETYYRTTSKGSSERGASVTALTSDGSVLTLADFKADIPFRVNPNKYNAHADFLESLYLNPDRKLERKVFGNNNLLLMNPGPGSTFKPVLLGSVTSQYYLESGWDNLRFGGLNDYPSETQGKDFIVKHFGGKSGIRLITGRPSGEHTLKEYLLNSTNSYNSMILFLGSHDATTLRTIFNESSGILRKGLSVNPTGNFPVINRGNSNYTIKTLPDWNNPNAVFYQGLWYNFNLPYTPEQAGSISTRLSQKIAGGINDNFLLKSISSYSLWSQPNDSYLYAVDRNTSLANAISQISMGGYPIQVTPIKMAEMAGRLFGMNAGLQPSVLKNRNINQKPFSYGNWVSEDTLASFYMHHVFSALHDVPIEGTITQLKDLSAALSNKGLHLYAKTGTISGGQESSDKNRDKNLLLIISRDPVHEKRFSSAKSLRNNKFVVLYFNFRKDNDTGGWNKEALSAVKSIIHEVVSSHSFNQLIHSSHENL